MLLKRLFRSQEKIKEDDLQAPDVSARPNPPPLQSSQPPNQEIVENQKVVSFYERDNRATRILRLSRAGDFWQQYRNNRLKSPFQGA